MCSGLRFRRACVRHLVALVCAAAAAFAGASAALASSGQITQATATPDWTSGSVAGSVTWDGCSGNNAGGNCSWVPLAAAQPSTPSYACYGTDRFSSDPNIRQVWNGGGQTNNGTVSFNVPNASILYGVYGQRLCVYVLWTNHIQDPVCIAQAPILGIDPSTCPIVDRPTSTELVGAFFTVQQPSPTTYPLSVSVAGSGRGVVTGGGISCPTTCSVAAAGLVTLTPSAKPGSRFAGWSGGGCAGVGPCTVTVSRDTAVTATFVSLPPSLSDLGMSPSKFVLTGRQTNGHCVAVTSRNRKKHACGRPLAVRVRYGLSDAARVRFTVSQKVRGHFVQRGAFSRSGSQGINSFTLDRRTLGHELAVGAYRLTAVPVAHLLTGAARSTAFQLTR